PMDHEVVVREKMTERYLLDELDEQQREQFEEHYFDCAECALDVKAAAMFVDQSRLALAKEQTRAVAAAPATEKSWFSWLRPAFAVPALALLLVVVGYQNLVVYPKMERALNQPQLLPWASVNTRVRGASVPTIAVLQGARFLLFVNIPPDGNAAHYMADLYNPAGKLEWSMSIPASSVQDEWPVQVPGAERQAGEYTLAVREVTPSGETKEVGRALFDLQIQK
ncbi:MAG TPA: zf-HC2 domain-containing protein, partial [Candidatus Binatia bacterium]|nr:zf-HC2 domain-containing protein [Candidatus Binatia bacterium]